MKSASSRHWSTEMRPSSSPSLLPGCDEVAEVDQARVQVLGLLDEVEDVGPGLRAHGSLERDADALLAQDLDRLDDPVARSGNAHHRVVELGGSVEGGRDVVDAVGLEALGDVTIDESWRSSRW